MFLNPIPRRSQRIAAQKRRASTVSTISITDSAQTETNRAKATKRTKVTNYIESEASAGDSGTELEEESGAEQEDSLDTFLTKTDDDCCSRSSYDSRYESGNDEYEIDDFVTEEDTISEYNSTGESEMEDALGKIVPAKRKRRLIRRTTPLADESATGDEEHNSASPPGKKKRLRRIRRCIESSDEGETDENYETTEGSETDGSETDESIVVCRRRSRPPRRTIILDDSSSENNAMPDSPEPTSPFTNTSPAPLMPLPYQSFRSNSTSSNLFCTDSDAPRRPSTRSSRSSGRPSIPSIHSHSPCSEAQAFASDDPEEIVTFIQNGISRFSQRCDGVQCPLLLTLSEAVRDDYRVREALRDAVRLRLAKMVGIDAANGGLGDNGDNEIEVWTIGPMQKKSLSGYLV